MSKLVTCMSNQETAKRILLDHGDDWEDAKEMAIRDEDAAFVLKKMQMRRPQINSLSLEDNARRKICHFHNTRRGCKFGEKCRFQHVDKEEKPKEKKTNNNKGPTKQTKHWIMNNRDAVVAMLELDDMGAGPVCTLPSPTTSSTCSSTTQRWAPPSGLLLTGYLQP